MLDNPKVTFEGTVDLGLEGDRVWLLKTHLVNFPSKPRAQELKSIYSELNI